MSKKKKSQKTEREQLLETLDNYIEFAEARKRFADVWVYKRIKTFIENA